MEYKMISPEAALSVKQFLYPGVAEDPDLSKFFFYGAIKDDGGLTGLLALDPALNGMRILSIGMSPDFCGKGYGSALLEAAVRDVEKKAGEKENSGITVRAEFVQRTDEAKKLSDFFEKNAFLLEEACPFYRMTLLEAGDTELIRKAEKKEKPAGLVSLKEVSDKALKNFSNRVINKGLYPGIRREGLEENVSIFYMPEKDEIEGCLLFEKETDGSLINTWLYVSKEALPKMTFQYMFLEAYERAVKIYPQETGVGFLAYEKESDRMILREFPKIRPESEICTCVRALVMGENERGQDDPVFEEISLENMCCKDCIYNKGKVMECDKYSVKSDAVLEGGSCLYFDED